MGVDGAQLDDTEVRSVHGAHRDDAIGDGRRLVGVVGHEHRRRRRRAQDPGQLGGEAVVQLAVEPGERLVEQDRAGCRGQGAGHRHPLGLAAAQLGHRPRAEAVEADEGEHLGHPAVPLGRRDLLHPQAERDVGGHVQVGEQLLVLEHHADAAAVGRHRVTSRPSMTHRAGRRRTRPAITRSSVLLPAARRSEQGDDLAVADGHIGVIAARVARRTRR